MNTGGPLLPGKECVMVVGLQKDYQTIVGCLILHNSPGLWRQMLFHVSF